MRNRGGRWWALQILTLALVGVAVAGVPPQETQGVVAPFAIVGGEAISQAEYQSALHEGMRRKFFHGAPSQEQVDAYRREVAQALIDRALLRQEAKNRGLEGDDLLGRLDADVRRVPEPGAEEVRGYYNAHPDKFTAPERLRVALILLKVEPSATGAAWKAAEAEAARLVGRLRQAEPQRREADFAELARLHSGDVSAGRGGDLGYVHKGMLAGEAQQVLDGMKPGDVSAPLLLLQGVAVLRLEERVAPALSAFDAAKSRARDLLARERGEVAWQALIERLRRETPVTINEEKDAGP
ncbi:MAG: peptidylprolyl isomerase [Gammaproteobacteria bacterium]